MGFWKMPTSPLRLESSDTSSVIDAETDVCIQEGNESMQNRDAGQITIIRAGLHLTGKIRTTDDILLEGVVDGEVSANSVTVTEGAILRGTLSAAFVRVLGVVEGTIECIKLQVDTTGRVSGDIYQTVMVVEAGAEIEGNIFKGDRGDSKNRSSVPQASGQLRSEPLMLADQASPMRFG